MALKQKLLLSFFIFLFSALPLLGHTGDSNNPATPVIHAVEQTNTNENPKENPKPKHTLNQYKRYLPYCCTAVKNIPRLYSFITLVRLAHVSLTRTGREWRLYRTFPLIKMQSIALLISYITAMENIYRHNNAIQENTTDKKEAHSSKGIVEISWNLSKVISYPALIISTMSSISNCDNLDCTTLRHIGEIALALSTGYDTCYKPMLELIDAYRAIRTQKNKTTGQKTTS